MLPSTALVPLQTMNCLLALDVCSSLMRSFGSTLKMAAHRSTYTFIGLTVAELTRLYILQSESHAFEAWSCRAAGAAIGYVYDNRQTVTMLTQKTIDCCTRWTVFQPAPENIVIGDLEATVANRI